MPQPRLRSTWFLAFTSFALALGLSALPLKGAAQTAEQAGGQTVPATRVPSRLTQTIDEHQRVTLKGTVHRLANAANDRGAVDDGLALERVQIVLKRSGAQETALRQLIQDLHTPGTANYHKWLTPAQFGTQFGPSDEDIATISKWLSSNGFTVTKVNPGKQTLEFSGNAGQFRSTFHTQIHKYQVNGQMHTASESDPQIPAALAPVFGGFPMLNNFPMKSHAKVLGTAAYDPVTHKATPNWTQGVAGYAPVLLLAPADFAVQYDVNPLYTAGVTGTGVTIGIINESNIDVSLVNQYRTLFGLPANAPNVIIDGNDPGIDGVNNPDGPNGAAGEAYLDVEQAGAVAPGATIDLVIASDTALSYGLFLAAEHAVYDDVAPVLSLSFGGCESPGAATAFGGVWEQAAAQGQTVVVSSGDSGSANCDDDTQQDYAVQGQRVSGTAATPWNVAVGGTDMYFTDYATGFNDGFSGAGVYWTLQPTNSSPIVSLNKRAPEQPFNSSQYGFDYIPNLEPPSGRGGSSIFAAGGGASNCGVASGNSCVGTPKPSFQVGAGVPADGVRDVPDVSMFGALYSNLVITPVCAGDGDCQPVAAGGTVQTTQVGGTSVAAPSFAGIMALVNQKYGPQGQADYVLYPLATQFPSTSATPVFNDVTVGTNSVPCNIDDTSIGNFPPNDCIAVAGGGLSVTDKTYGTATEGEIGTGTTAEYNAGPNYDLASGLGSVDANNLVTNWNKVTFTSSAVTLTPSQTTFAHGTAITISGAVTPGAATGNVALETTSTVPLNLNTFALAGGTYSASVNNLPGGTYDIYGSYSGDGTYAPSTSGKTSITVTPEASTTTLQALDSTANAAFTNGQTISYGMQVLLDAGPVGSVSAGNSTTPTGTVNYLDATTSIGSAPVNSEGKAELNYAPPVSTTPYSITAQYSGDSSYNASTSNTVTFTVAKDQPSLNVYSSTESGSQSFNAVSGDGTLIVSLENQANQTAQGNTGAAYVNSALAPTGMVTITGLPSGTLTSPALAASIDPSTLFVQGVASIPLPAEAAGTYSITVTYPGDANYAGVSIPGNITITSSTETASTTTVTASPAALTTQSPITFNVTVAGAAGKAAPTGTVALLFGAYYDGPYTLTAASATTSTVSVTVDSRGLLTGQNPIVAQYSGDSTYAPSYGTLTVTAGSATTYTLSSSGSINLTAGNSGSSTITVTPANFTGTVALSCAVTPSAAASTPTCSLGSSSAALNGSASVATMLTVNTTATTLPGNYVVTVTGTSGSLAFTTSVVLTVAAPTTTPGIALTNSGPITLAAGGASGTSTITVTPSGGFTGAVALTCAVTGAGATAPTCTVSTPGTITGTTPGTATLTVVSTAGTSAGNYTVTVTGTGTGITAATTAVAVTVEAATTTPAIALSNSGSVTLAAGGTTGTSTITVTPAGGFTGAVALTCAVTGTGTTAPACSVTSPVTISGTTAATSTLTVTSTSSTTAGAYTVTVTGTGTGVTAATTTVSVTVQAATTTPTVALSDSGSITIASAGDPGTSTVTVTPGGGFTGSVALACSISSTVAEPPTCSITSPVTISGTTAGTATLTVNTTAASAALEMPRMRLLPIGGGVAAAALLFFLVPMKRRRISTLLGALVLIAVIGFSTGCGGGGSAPPTNPGTPAGTYTVTVSGTASGVTITPITVSATVQ